MAPGTTPAALEGFPGAPVTGEQAQLSTEPATCPQVSATPGKEAAVGRATTGDPGGCDGTRTCPYCEAPIRTPTVGAGMIALGAFKRHVVVCVRRSAEERAYFRSHRRWPPRQHRQTTAGAVLEVAVG